MFKKFVAFTLAEVLITLGIIGVVAAMTVPTLISKYFEKAMESKRLKTITTLANGYKLMMTKEGVYDIAQLPLLKCGDNAGCYSENHAGIFANMPVNSNMLPSEYAIDGSEDKSPFKWENVPYIFATKDGVPYGIKPDDGNRTFSVFVDLNGDAGPNTVAADMYKFRVSGNASVVDITAELSNTLPACASNRATCSTQEDCEAVGWSWYYSCFPVGETTQEECQTLGGAYVWSGNGVCQQEI